MLTIFAKYLFHEMERRIIESLGILADKQFFLNHGLPHCQPIFWLALRTMQYRSNNISDVGHAYF